MTITAESLISTSVTDAQISLNAELGRNPENAKAIAQALQKNLEGKEGQATRLKLAKSIIRKADKLLKPR